ncbi:reverse transcriptase domain-containing protein [Tanacetum coccineum]
MLREAIELANSLMDQKVRAYAARKADNKRRMDNNLKDNYCKLHHNRSCTVKCVNFKKVGHITQDCRSPTAASDQRTLTCFECGNQGHYRSECPRLKN